MKPFMDEEFLLSTPTARLLYHDYAEELPVLDYHCHIKPFEILSDRRYENLGKIMLGGGGYGDHYKWRLMRASGVPERLITGDADDYEKFLAFAKILPMAVGNPVYHWTHLELKRYFACDLPLHEGTADEIWKHCNEKLRVELSVREIISLSNVYGIVTTDDPADSLECHAAIAADATFKTALFPAWRPDRLLSLGAPGFSDYINALGGAENMEALRALVRGRMDHFDARGCRASDHGLTELLYIPASEEELNRIFKKAMAGELVTCSEEAAYRFALLRFMGEEYAKRDWVMEIHYGALRNLNSDMFGRLGADTGYDAIKPGAIVDGLPTLLDMLSQKGMLPRTILFSLNPGDFTMLSTICSCFHQEGKKGWVQQGMAWWFNDSHVGMSEQMIRMASLAPLGVFLGMVTDSRSFLSYARHEYFRRILCDVLGRWVENGEYPNDIGRLGGLVEDICCNNTKEFFRF